MTPLNKSQWLKTKIQPAINPELAKREFRITMLTLLLSEREWSESGQEMIREYLSIETSKKQDALNEEKIIDHPERLVGTFTNK